jgi:hypothetical protein
VFKLFVVLTGITIAVLQGDIGLTQGDTPVPGSVPVSQCQIVSSTSGSLVGNATPPSELLPGRLMTVRVICDRPSIISVYIENGHNVLQNGVAEIALVNSGSSGVYKGLPSSPNWSQVASFSAPTTQDAGGDYLSVAARIRSNRGELLRSGSYSLKIKVSIQPSS